MFVFLNKKTKTVRQVLNIWLLSELTQIETQMQAKPYVIIPIFPAGSML